MKKLMSFYIILIFFTSFSYAATYSGGFYQIIEETVSHMADIKVTLTDNGNSYTIGVGTLDIDNVQMDTDGNLSRDGYISVDGVNNFFLSGYLRNDSLVFRYGIAFISIDPELLIYTLEFKGKAYTIPTIPEMEAQGLVQQISDLNYTATGTWGDNKSVSVQISDLLWFGSYMCKYNLNANDFLSISTEHPAVVVYRGEIQQPIEVLEENGINRFLFKTEEAGMYYVQITDTPSYSDADYLFNIHRYGQLQSLSFGNTSHITSDLSENEIKNALQHLTITGIDAYEQHIDFTGYWNVNMEEQKATFIPVFLPFEEFDFPLSANVNNEISWLSNNIAETLSSLFIIFTQNLQINILGTTEDINIYNIDGQLVTSGNATSSYVVPKAGIYIVKVGKVAKKVIIN